MDTRKHSRENKGPLIAVEETPDSMFQMLKGSKFESRLEFETGETSHEKLMYPRRKASNTEEKLPEGKKNNQFKRANEESDETFWGELTGAKFDSRGRPFETGENSYARLTNKIKDVYYSNGREKERD